jgi:hypothetical protein
MFLHPINEPDDLRNTGSGSSCSHLTEVIQARSAGPETSPQPHNRYFKRCQEISWSRFPSNLESTPWEGQEALTKLDDNLRIIKD